MSVSLVIFGKLEGWLLKPTKRNASILTVVPYSKQFVQDGSSILFAPQSAYEIAVKLKANFLGTSRVELDLVV